MVLADANRDRFSARLKTIEKKAAPGKRMVKRVREDGLVVDVVKSDRKRLLPFKGILIAALILVSTKGFILARVGEVEYFQRLSELSQGNAVEVAAAFLLDADPATKMVAGFLDDTLF